MKARARQGVVDPCHVVLFWLMRTFNPGGAEERVQLMYSVHNPAVCSQARAAQAELLRWKEALRDYRSGFLNWALLFLKNDESENNVTYRLDTPLKVHALHSNQTFKL